MTNILEEICNQKRYDIIGIKQRIPASTLYKEVDTLMANGSIDHHSLTKALSASATGIIAEFKRKSPSLGWIRQELQPKDVVPNYQANGATAISILTDKPYFGGSLDYIAQMRPIINIPILRKDFILDEYQVFEAKKVGADAILLIAACLTIKDCRQLAYKAKELEMDVLLEIHEERDLDYICDGVTVIGVNNRDLKIFKSDIQTSLRLVGRIPDEYIKISESGLKTTSDLRLLRKAGFQGFLMGEHFMKHPQPAKALEELIQEL